MALRGHSVLIIENDVGNFVTELQAAVEKHGAESLVVRDPLSANSVDRLKQFKFTSALVNSSQQTGVSGLGIPTVVYDGETPTQIVVRLLKLLLR